MKDDTPPIPLQYADGSTDAPPGPGSWRIAPLILSSAVLLTGIFCAATLIFQKHHSVRETIFPICVIILIAYPPFALFGLSVSSAGKRRMIHDPLAWITIAGPVLLVADAWLAS